jgi:putative SOS response-associated peptidase YedK
MSDAELRDIAKKAKENSRFKYRDISLKTSGEIYPADTVPVQTAENEYVPMKWGFPLTGKKLLINARFETFTQKPLFHSCFRCLIPASGYFEWKHDTNPKVKYAFSLPQETLFLAGLYRTGKENQLPEFVILTCDAVKAAKEIHHRMPVIIPRESFADWFSDSFDIAAAITAVECKEADNPGQVRFDF